MSRTRPGAALLAAVAMVTMVGAAPAIARPAPPGDEDLCEVHTLALPPEAVGGNVMDIEHVPGRGVVYYGTFWTVDPGGVERQQAVLWYELDGPPVPVGPVGPDEVAYELTRTGLINGETLDPATGRWRAWVQKIRTGRLTWVDPGVPGAEPGAAFVRRINDRGAAAGSRQFPDGTVRTLSWRLYHHDPDVLTGPEWVFAEALGINNHRDTVGAAFSPATGEEFFVPRPLRWTADGTMTAMATSTLAAAYPRLINDAGQAAGNIELGEEWATAHREAAFWPTADEVVGLGLLPGGGLSDGFGLDANGRVAGRADVYDPDDPGADEFGSAWYGFLWTPDDPGSVQVLPSPYAWERGLTDWRAWYGGAVHGVNAELDQVGTNAHGGYLEDGGTLRFVPTVYVDASACGRRVLTTHTPFWQLDPAAGARSLLSEDEATRSGAPAYGRPAPGDHGGPVTARDPS